MAIKPFLIGSWDKSWQWSGLLSFETSRKLDLQNYKSLVKAIIKKENRIYDAMIKDIFIGKNLDRKPRFLNASPLIITLFLFVSSLIIISAI